MKFKKNKSKTLTVRSRASSPQLVISSGGLVAATALPASLAVAAVVAAAAAGVAFQL